MKIKNLEQVMDNLRPYLRTYLEEFDTVFTNAHFTCPNRVEHRNEDSKPSAAFFPNPDAFKCFSCEISGDIFSCAHYLEGKPLSGGGFIKDNVLYLAEKFAVPFEAEDYTPEEKKKEELYKVLEDTCELCHLALKANNPKLEPVQKYIQQRGWKGLIDDFKFGYCIYDKLIEILKKKGYTDETLIEVGLLNNPETQKTNYAKYLLDDRLIFPIKNYYGKTVAFGSRIIRAPKNDDEQKYLNSKNTILYNKGMNLFNLDKARLSQKVYIVEGYADVFTLHKQGIDNAIALCGLSFKEERYKLLVKNGITEAVFCLDNDEAGRNALKRIVDQELKNLRGVNISIKEIPAPYKDVDEYLNKEDLKSFKELPELTVFDWKLEKLKKNQEDIILKNDIIKLVVSEEDYTKKEAMCNKLSGVINISTDSIRKEVERHQKYEKGKYLTTSEDILEELQCFERVLNDWDRKVWSRTGKLLGLDAKKFPIFTKYMDGVQNAFYIFAGGTNIGKSAFLLNLGLDVIASNDDTFVLFLSIDDSLSQLLPRMVSLDIDVPINTISNPKYKVKFNDELSQELRDEILKLRANGIDKLKGLADRFAIKEESDVKTLEDIEKYIQIYKKIAGAKQLVVLVDNIHRILSNKKMDTRQLYIEISDRLKYWKTHYDIPVITTAEIRKTLTPGSRATINDIAETVRFGFDSDVLGLLYSDFYHNQDTNLKFATEDTEGEAESPIVEINIVKNKTSGFKSRLYYKFYPEFSKYIECTRDETSKIFNKEMGIDG